MATWYSVLVRQQNLNRFPGLLAIHTVHILSVFPFFGRESHFHTITLNVFSDKIQTVHCLVQICLTTSRTVKISF